MPPGLGCSIATAAELLLNSYTDQTVSTSTRQDSCGIMQALVRVEGLVRGGAAGLDGFLDMLKPLRQPLTVQVNDRSEKTLVGSVGGRGAEGG